MVGWLYQNGRTSKPGEWVNGKGAAGAKGGDTAKRRELIEVLDPPHGSPFFLLSLYFPLFFLSNLFSPSCFLIISLCFILLPPQAHSSLLKLVGI